jgi:toxin ParE1/3/4
MKVAYAPHAQADLEAIAEYSRRAFAAVVTVALETYLRAAVARIAAMPAIGELVAERPNVRVVPLVRYPFRIFYLVDGDTVTILHIRHTARQQWQGRQQRTN